MKKTIEVNVYLNDRGEICEFKKGSSDEAWHKENFKCKLLCARTIEYGEAREDEVKKEVESWKDLNLKLYSGIDYEMKLPKEAQIILKKYEGKRCRFTVEVLE